MKQLTDKSMKIRVGLAGVLGAGMLSACASQPGINTLTREQRERVSVVEVIHEGATRPGTVIGRVAATGCQKTVYDLSVDAETEALQRLRIAAAALDADAVIHTSCREALIDWFTNCWGLIECSGEAFRYGERRGAE